MNEITSIFDTKSFDKVLTRFIGTDNQQAKSLIDQALDQKIEWPERGYLRNAIWSALSAGAAKDRKFVTDTLSKVSESAQTVAADILMVQISPTSKGGYKILLVPDKEKGVAEVIPKGFPDVDGKIAKISDIATSLFGHKITQIEAAEQIQAVTGIRSRVIGHGPGTAI